MIRTLSNCDGVYDGEQFKIQGDNSGSVYVAVASDEGCDGCHFYGNTGNSGKLCETSPSCSNDIIFKIADAIPELESELKPNIKLKEHKFKSAYIANFLSSYMANRYDRDCANGHIGDLALNRPIGDAIYLADCAWESYVSLVDLN